MGYIDSHAHLCCEQLYRDIDNIIASFSQNQIARVLLICCDSKEYERARQLINKYDCFDVAFGIHPESANEYEEDDLLKLEAELSAGLIKVVGEIGLDYYWVKDNKTRQQELFIRQLALADKYDLAIAVHSRDASEDTYNILKSHHRSKKGILHCYSGSVEMMERYVKLGYHISLAGPVTFANARTTVEVAKALPLNRLLYETDCPYLTPVPFRGKRNDPNLVIYTAAKIAELKNIAIEELNAQVSDNYRRLLEKKDGQIS